MSTSTTTRVSEEFIQQFDFKGNSHVTAGHAINKKKNKNMYTNDTKAIEHLFLFLYWLLVSDYDSSTIILSNTQYYDNKYKY